MGFKTLLLAAEPGAATNTTASTLVMVAWVAVIFVAFYFLMIRPQRKKAKEEKEMRDSLQVGDEIVTIGGIYGRVISLKEDTIVIESKSDHSKITIARWALQTNLTRSAEKKDNSDKKEKSEKK